MTKNELTTAVETAKMETKNALQTVYDSLNQGQQKKILKEDAVKELFDRYGVTYEKGGYCGKCNNIIWERYVGLNIRCSSWRCYSRF